MDDYLYAVMTDGGYIEIFDSMDEARVDFVKQLDLGEEVYLVKRGPLSAEHRRKISEALRGRRRGGRRLNRKTEMYRFLHSQTIYRPPPIGRAVPPTPRQRNVGGLGYSDDTLHFSMAPRPRYTRTNRRPLREGARPGHARVIHPKPRNRKKEPKALQAYRRVRFT